jgi:hypothetical protein
MICWNGQSKASCQNVPIERQKKIKLSEKYVGGVVWGLLCGVGFSLRLFAQVLTCACFRGF